MVKLLVLGLWAGLRVGGVFPQPFSPLETNLTFGVEGGVALPYHDGMFGIDAQIQYSQPPAEGSADDPRLAPMTYDWSITQRELTIGVRGLLRGYMAHGKLVPYVGIGPRLYLLETHANGAAGGQPLGEHKEVSTEIGASIAGGIVYAIASAGLFAEVGLGISGLDHVTTGSSTTGQLEAIVGARLSF